MSSSPHKQYKKVITKPKWATRLLNIAQVRAPIIPNRRSDRGNLAFIAKLVFELVFPLSKGAETFRNRRYCRQSWRTWYCTRGVTWVVQTLAYFPTSSMLLALHLMRRCLAGIILVPHFVFSAWAACFRFASHCKGYTPAMAAVM